MKSDISKKILIRVLIIAFFLSITSTPARAINMKVGDVEQLSLGYVQRLQGCEWTISRPNDVVFTSTPTSYSTDVFVKAIKAFPTTSPCIVQCKYYYLEQDPVTGKFTYSRSGFKDWEIYVTESGSGGSNPGGGNSSLKLAVIEADIRVDEWVTIDALTSSTDNLSWSLSNTACAYFVKKTNTQIKVRGVCPGTTNVTCKDSKGNKATCKIIVSAKDPKEYSVGDYIYSEVEGKYGNKYLFRYLITDTEDPQCMLHGMGDIITPETSFKGDFITPYDIQGFKVVGISESAFRKCKGLESIIITDNIKEIKNSVFEECYNLTNAEIMEGVEIIGKYCFTNCNNLINLTIPSSVKSIGSWLLFCVRDINVKCYINPPINVPDLQVPEKSTLYVPYGSKALYEQTPGWNDFTNIVEMENMGGIDDLYVDPVDNKEIYTVSGMKLDGFTLDNLPKGIYIIGGKKVMVH